MHLGPFGCFTKLGAKWAEVVQKVGRATKLRQNFSQRTHLIHPIGPKSDVLVHFILFGCLTKLGAKQAELVQKFVPQSRVGIFRNEHARSNPLDPKLMF